MRLRIRGPEGQSFLTLQKDSTIGDLRTSIAEKTSVHSFDLKYGYPPKPLVLDSFDDASKLTELPIKLDGEQLLVSVKQPGRPTDTSQPKQTLSGKQKTTQDSTNSLSKVSGEAPNTGTSSSFSFTGVGEAPPANMLDSPHQPRQPNQPLSLQRKPNLTVDDPPEVFLPSRAAKLVLRIMPDDNSCLFRAFGSAFFGIMGE
ncbi:MAG: hypothetical protein Q9208_001796 [Pyrenodesmia sp. 3 TL-2023]